MLQKMFVAAIFAFSASSAFGQLPFPLPFPAPAPATPAPPVVVPAWPSPPPTYSAEIGGFRISDRHGQKFVQDASRFRGTGSGAALASGDARVARYENTRQFNGVLDSIGSPTHAVVTPVYPAPVTVAVPVPVVVHPPRYGCPPYVWVPTPYGGYYLGGY